MKIRLDFVTNSSSTSSAIAGTSAILGILGGLSLASCQCGEPGGEAENGGSGGGGGGNDDDLKNAALEAALAASEQSAKEAAENLAADAAERDQLINDALTAEERRLNATEMKLNSEIEQYQKQWEAARATADPTDPASANLDKEYIDYIDYLKNQLEQVKAQQYEALVAQAEEKIARESRSEWVKQQQQDLVQVMEQKAFLEAVAKGYGKDKDYDISKVKSQLDQLNSREQDLHKTLRENNASIDYTPRQRDEIGPDPELARINREYKQKQQQLQKELDTAKEARNKVKREELERKMQMLEKDMETQASRAAFWNTMTKAAEVTQVGADIGVDVLSNVTGPYGKTVKTCYTGLKALGSGFGEGLAKGDMAKNILKGGVNGLSDIAKDKIGEKWGKAAQNIYTIGSETGKSVLESALDGKTSAKDLTKAALAGASKGSLDASLNVIADGILPSGQDMPNGLDWSDINAKTFINSVKNSNPLTVRNLGREAIGNSLQNAGVDQIKNFIKGDDVVFSGWNQDFTGNAIDTGSSIAAPKYAPFAAQTAQSLGTGAKNAANTISQLVNPTPKIPYTS